MLNDIRNTTIQPINPNATFQNQELKIVRPKIQKQPEQMEQLTAAVQGLTVSNLNTVPNTLYQTPTNLNRITLPQTPSKQVQRVPLQFPPSVEVKTQPSITSTIIPTNSNEPIVGLPTGLSKIYTRADLEAKGIKKDDLQAILKTMRAKISGNKPELIDRILETQNKLLNM